MFFQNCLDPLIQLFELAEQVVVPDVQVGQGNGLFCGWVAHVRLSDGM